MAPLTRFRADEDHVPLPFVAEYYSQRGSVPGTLLIAEATFIALQAGGYPNIPGIWNEAQIAAWKKVTDAVHANDSFIFLQLWALGRTANADFLNYESRAIVKSSSDVPMKGGVVPTPLTEEEIWGYVGYYKQAANNAISAGFDGIELHGANGYLIDQFLQDVTNKRTDDWGGGVEKRARFGIEVTKAVVDAIGAERTAIRLSPYSKFKGMGMKSKYLGE
jgi:NADPH2 dehydrogenase